jgi:hypothetical protein
MMPVRAIELYTFNKSAANIEAIKLHYSDEVSET